MQTSFIESSLERSAGSPISETAAALERAIALAGGLTAFARKVGRLTRNGRLSANAVSKWRRGGVPLDRCPAIELVTDGQVRSEDLRPDVQWERDAAGAVISYRVNVPAPGLEAA